MKKFIVLLLVALMIVGLCVSCKEDPKKQKPDKITVMYVVNGITDSFSDFGNYIDELVTGAKTGEALEAEIIEDLSDADKGLTADAKVTEKSIWAHLKDADNIFTFDINLTELSIDDESVVTGKFAMKATDRVPGGISLSTNVKGSFESGSEDSIVCTSVIVNGNEYEVDEFNKALEEALNPDID